VKRLAVLGSTGSIGRSVLDVVGQHPARFEIVGLAAGRNAALLARQIEQFRPRYVAVQDDATAALLRQSLPPETGPREILVGLEGAVALATAPEADLVVSAMVGSVGLRPTLAAIERGAAVALANKETLVVAGPLVMAAAAARGVAVIPVDSEHSAIFQALQGHRPEDVRRLWLTASGGPFRQYPAAELARVTPAAALNHPNWNMGPKITIDSATLMNKGLEVIEARVLFGVPPERIEVHIHPQSIIHSLVEYIDGSVLAQLGIPDMRGPIAYALAYPERIPLDLPPLDLFAVGQLSFERPDLGRFPCLALAYDALKAGGTMPAVLNAANEVAVAAFLEGAIAFLDIPRVISRTMEAHRVQPLTSVDQVLAEDEAARRQAKEIISRLKE